MVSSDVAAFRILEIVAILFPLLLIVMQMFSGHIFSDDSAPLENVGQYLQLFSYAAFVLTMAAVLAVFQLATQDFSIWVKLAVLTLYVAFLLIGLPTGYIGQEMRSRVEQQSQQVDLSESATQTETEVEEKEREPETARE